MRATLTFVGVFAVLIVASSVEGALVGYWNFNNYNGNDHSILSDQGADAAAVLDIDAAWPSSNIATQTGTTLNAVGATAAGTGVQFGNPANNGRSFTIQADLSQRQDAVLSFAYRRSATGFNNVDLFYSKDGVGFTKFADVDNAGTGYTLHSYDFSAINPLDGASTAFFRFVLDGASGSGNARFDNIQLNAVPESASLAMLGVFSLAFLAVNRRRLQRACDLSA